MKMPKMNGIEFITIAKQRYPQKFFMILTGYDVLNEISQALESKLIEKYFCKPFNKVEILEKINELLGKVTEQVV